MKHNWFTKATDYITKTRTTQASPSRTVSETCGHHAQPIIFEDPNGQKHTDGYLEAAGDFVRATLARAAVTVSAWTEEPTTLTTNPNETRGSILISAEGILRRGSDPAIAADFATGRGLIAASRKEYLLVKEEKDMRRSEETYRFYSRSGSKPDIHLSAPGYAAAHLAATIATVRGRESVLKSWAGFAGYFAAAEVTVYEEEANAFINGKAPPIVRAAFALGREVDGHPAITLPPELEPMLEAGRAAMDAQPWKRGAVHDNAFTVIQAMHDVQPPYEPEPEGDSGSGSADDEQSPDGNGNPIPGSSMDYMKPDEHHSAWESAKHTPADAKPSASKAAENSAGTRYPVTNFDVTSRKASTDEMKELRTDAAPMIAALSRIVWDSETPPTVDHAQLRGDLDEGNLLTLAAFKDPRVFQVRQEVGRATVAIHILVDCSGSMFTGTKHGSHRMRDAKAVAYAMGKAFTGSRYRVTISGHDVQYGGKPQAMNYVCKTVDDIVLLRASGDNADGYAIAHCIDQLAAVKADRKALFLLADGQPSANGYGGPQAQQHVRKVVDGAKARGVNFLAIGIENSMQKHGSAQFGRHFINLPDTRSAAPLLARVIGKITKEAISSCE
jgi:Mg-chelatase subunit ChlD